MSGSVAAAITGAVGLALDFLGPDQSVSLGDFVFAKFEVPEKVSWGGAQKLVVHKQLGGTRIIDALGPDDAEISWSGIFLSADASQRADRLDAMRREGARHELIFADRLYTVLIADVRFDTRQLNHVPYQLTCTVLDDNSAYASTKESPLQTLTNKLSEAMGVDAPAILQEAQLAITYTQALLLPIVQLVGGSEATAAVATSLGTASSLVGAAQGIAAGQISGLAQAALVTGNMLGAVTPIGAQSGMATAVTAASTLAAGVAIGSYLGVATLAVAGA